MSNFVRYSSTALVGTNKAGTLTADEDGYYDMVLGGYGTSNYAGAYYTTSNNGESIESILKRSHTMQRQISNGNFRAEYGHPKMEPGMKSMDFKRRALRMEETRICAHIAEVFLENDFKTRQGETMVAVRGKVRPSGPYGKALDEQIKNGKENVCFSVRSLTNDVFVRGQLIKKTAVIVCWDYVNEGGIVGAEKYSSPSLESLHDEVITPDFLVALAQEEFANKEMGIENNGPSAEEIAKAVGWGKLIRHNGKLPRSLEW